MSGQLSYSAGNDGVSRADLRAAHSASRRAARRGKQKKGSGSMYALQGLTAAQLHHGKPKRFSFCCVVWWVVFFLLWVTLLITGLFVAGSLIFRHSYSAMWTVDPWEYKEIPSDYSVNIRFDNFYGDLRVREDPRGTEYPTIRRVDLANRHPSALRNVARPAVTVDDMAKTALIDIKGFGFWDYLKCAGRKAEFTLLLPLNVHVDTVSISIGNGVFTYDAPSVHVRDMKFNVALDLINILGSVSLLNGRVGRISGTTVKPHVCIGAFEHADCSHMRVVGDATHTTGMLVGGLGMDSVAGNFHVSHTIYTPSEATGYEGWTPTQARLAVPAEAGNTWSGKTFNGFVHMAADSAVPDHISAKVTTSTFKFASTPVVQITAPSPLLDGYSLSPGALFKPEAHLKDNCIDSTGSTSCDGSKTITALAGFGDIIVEHLNP